jgi:hypothetical protein
MRAWQESRAWQEVGLATVCLHEQRVFHHQHGRKQFTYFVSHSRMCLDIFRDRRRFPATKTLGEFLGEYFNQVGIGVGQRAITTGAAPRQHQTQEWN